MRCRTLSDKIFRAVSAVFVMGPLLLSSNLLADDQQVAKHLADNLIKGEVIVEQLVVDRVFADALIVDELFIDDLLADKLAFVVRGFIPGFYLLKQVVCINTPPTSCFPK